MVQYSEGEGRDIVSDSHWQHCLLSAYQLLCAVIDAGRTSRLDASLFYTESVFQFRHGIIYHERDVVAMPIAVYLVGSLLDDGVTILGVKRGLDVFRLVVHGTQP